ncbi:hypothetical protein PLESTB_001288000 [Pleodorina starrii]|uniref:Uncharacterized protein n=1 Tax=Pleodorina starrii TaxID=330485 RepID=A0A9W6BTG7_9CHLO|nr:hypothetical protein PLESTB_001288000 [Pleodorina starrii]GLC67101.1 hypothetical protein PLESTF_000515400 [Pleodorina starrii]
MPPVLTRITSFNLDVEDWYSCHTSDDEAYQDALERNSVASWYTARGAASTAASVVFTSIACGSPSRIADADQALAEMVPEPVDDARPQHEPPDLDEEDAPLSKRTRSISAGPLPSVYSPTISTTPVVKSKTSARQLVPNRRAQPSLLRTVATSAPSASSAKPSPPQPATPMVVPLRALISVLPDGVSVRLQLAPAIFCFGDVPLPLSAGASTDYSALLLGPEGGLDANSPDNDKAALGAEESTTPKAVPASKLDADCAVKLLTRPRGTTPYKPGSAVKGDASGGDRNPATPKDQNKAGKSEVAGEGKEAHRKPGGGFPGAFLQRLFYGRRDNRTDARGSLQNEPPPPPATVQELGSELLMASAAAAVAELANAAQLVPVVAGYVQAAPLGVAAAAVPAAASEAGPLDEAAAAAQRLSAEIFRNVLRTSAGGAGGAATPKGLLSPRDTAFQPLVSRTPQRDQELANAAAPPSNSTPAASGPQPQSPGVEATQASPCGAEAALALLVGLADDVTGDGAEPEVIPSAPNDEPLASHQNAAAVVVTKEATSAAVELPEGLLTPNLSLENLDCGGLPMPELEQCESPVTAAAPPPGAADLAASTSADAEAEADDADSSNAAESSETPAAAAAAPVASPAERAIAVAESGNPAEAAAAASPRTVSKRAYGTVARLVKKMAPNFRDSTMMSVSTNSVQAASMVTAAAAVPDAVAEGNANAATVAAERSPAEAESAEVHGNGNAPAETNDDGASGAVAAPALFVFGQEQPKSAKPSLGRTRSINAKTGAAAANDDAVAPAEIAGRKRKGDDEILPNAKVPVVAERSSSNTSQDSLGPVPSAERPGATASPLPSATDSVAPPAAAQPQAAATSAPSSAPNTEAPPADSSSSSEPVQGAALAAAAPPCQPPAAVALELPPSSTADSVEAPERQVLASTAPACADESKPVAAAPLALDMPATAAVTEAEIQPFIETAAEVAVEDAAAAAAPEPFKAPAMAAVPDEQPASRKATAAGAPAADAHHSVAAHGSIGGALSLPASPPAAAAEGAAEPAAAEAAAVSLEAPESSNVAAVQQQQPVTHIVQAPEPPPTAVSPIVPAVVVEVKEGAPAPVGDDLPCTSLEAPSAVAAHVQKAEALEVRSIDTQAAVQEPGTKQSAQEAATPPPVGEVEPAPAAAVTDAVAVPVVSERAAESQLPAERSTEKPAEGGKQKRRSSFALFGCFRA